MVDHLEGDGVYEKRKEKRNRESRHRPAQTSADQFNPTEGLLEAAIKNNLDKKRYERRPGKKGVNLLFAAVFSLIPGVRGHAGKHKVTVCRSPEPTSTKKLNPTQLGATDSNYNHGRYSEKNHRRTNLGGERRH